MSKGVADNYKVEYKIPKAGIYCVGSGTEICYKKCRLFKKKDEKTCICACCADKYKGLCGAGH